MKKMLLVLLALTAGVGVVQAQAGHFSLQAGYSYGSFLGSKSGYNSDQAPYMYTNLGALHGATIRGVYSLGEQWGIGLDCSYLQSNTWNNENDWSLYGSYAKQLHISPMIIGYVPLSGSNWLSRIKLVGDAGLVYGHSTIEIKAMLVTNSIGIGPFYERNSIGHSFYGLRADVGLEASLTENFGMIARYGLSVNKLSDNRIADNHLTTGVLTLGFSYQF